MLPALPRTVARVPQDSTPILRALGVTLLALATLLMAGEPAWAAKAKAKANAKTQAKARAIPPVALEGDADAVTYGRRSDAIALALALADKHGLDPAWVQAQLAQARFQPSVARLIMPPKAGTAKNWAAYRARFIEPERIRAGAAFWATHAHWLDAAEQRYGVPAAIVVGIIGVETYYGRHMGNFRIIDSLATLAFDFPVGRRDRSPFFRGELESYLVLCQQQGLDPLAMKGSYAGATGLPQFMPSSIARHAVDFDRDGRIDLHDSPADAIGSVARYLADFGWLRGLPTRFKVAAPVDSVERAHLLGPDILPSFSAQEFGEHGAVLPDDGAARSGLLALVELQNGDAAPSYVAGTTNFYAITRYNWSSYYAMAVIELGEAVWAQRPSIAR